MWRLSDGSLVRTLEGHAEAVNAVCVTPDGQHVVTASSGITARVWLLSDGSLVRTLEHTHTRLIGARDSRRSARGDGVV